MTGHGRSYGAFSVINAALCGIGVAVGVELHTDAVFERSGSAISGVERRIAEVCVNTIFDHIGIAADGWSLNVSSNIPIGQGMKSSSSLCNAIVLAVIDEFAIGMDDIDIVRLGVECARNAGITVTGAFDDACACHFGGFVMTDNRIDKMIMKHDIDDCDVVFCIPSGERRPFDPSDADKDMATVNVDTAMTDPFRAMTVNGGIMADATGTSNTIADNMLEHGALAAGMSGFGPAVTGVFVKGGAAGFAGTCGCEHIITNTRRQL